MQRRAAAVYLVIFVALAGGAYTYIEVGASEPEVSIDGPSYSEGDSFSVGDREYTVTTVEAEVEEGEHGAPDTVNRVGELTWFNESAVESAQLENGSTVAFNDAEYTVAIANESNVSSFDLVSNDSSNTETFSTGDTFPYQQENETVDANVTAIESSAVTLEWENPQNETIELEEGGNVTLNDEQYFAHFQSNSSVQVLASDEYYNAYQSELADIDAFGDRINGLWGIVILGLLASIILVSAAYLPNKG